MVVCVPQTYVAPEKVQERVARKYNPSPGKYVAPWAKRRDVIIIGGGHNGLVTAAYLAKQGLDVVVRPTTAPQRCCTSHTSLWPPGGEGCWGGGAFWSKPSNCRALGLEWCLRTPLMELVDVRCWAC